ncbi:PalH/RIM21-domain-containing protein [Xylariaceae sp. FL1272]|nr:PalH/RIM21-domain-containing protein [Xylariaceae sp. FL1272]
MGWAQPPDAMARRGAIIATGLTGDGAEALAVPRPEDFRDPFYASVFPQCYALAATTVLAYLLLIMLVIAPRSFLDGGVVTLGRRGFTNGHSNGITIGGRPWLQKVATLFVAISLTIASNDTFRVAEDQYSNGNFDAQKLQQMVLDGTQLQVIRLISDTFLWLAQAQTLIRLFPRQREKIIIKWTAFSLISLDVIFSALDAFKYKGTTGARPQQFTEAIPALSYLFQLSLGLLYAAWVLYYAVTKKKYAFYHPLMKNISLCAILSIASLLIPVTFFILDIAEPTFTVWGDYVRWVGAAAASVVVWEWVERIEALEREEKKDGVLGREIFDGDELIEVSPSDLGWPSRRRHKDADWDGDQGESGIRRFSGDRSNMWPAMSNIARRYRPRSSGTPSQSQGTTAVQTEPTGRYMARLRRPPLWPARPPPAATPVSRTDTASPDSTIYAVRYQPLTETTSRTTDERRRSPSRGETAASSSANGAVENVEAGTNRVEVKQIQVRNTTKNVDTVPGGRFGQLKQLNIFQRRGHDLPAECAPHAMANKPGASPGHEAMSKWDIRSRLEAFASSQADRILQQIRPAHDTESLPVTVIPAPPRRGAALAQLLEEEEDIQRQSSIPNASGPVPSATSAPAPRVMSNTSASRGTPRRRPSQGRKNEVPGPSLPNLTLQQTRSGHGESGHESSGRSGHGNSRERGFSERRTVDDTLGADTRQQSPRT